MRPVTMLGLTLALAAGGLVFTTGPTLAACATTSKRPT
jgi:hypothetical protein